MALETTLRTLAGFAAFRDLEAEAMRLIALSCDTRILRNGEVLFRRGEPADGAMVLLSGSVLMEGAGQAVTLRPPTLIGEVALVAATHRPATATTREPASVLRVPRATYMRVLGEYPRSAAAVHRRVAARVAALREEYEAAGRRLEE